MSHQIPNNNYPWYWVTAPTNQPQLPNPGLYSPGPSGGIPTPDKSPATIVSLLMDPPYFFFNPDNNTFTLQILWAIGIVDPQNFEKSIPGTRHFLSKHVDLYNQLQEAGLSREIFEWLRAKHGPNMLTLPASHFRRH